VTQGGIEIEGFGWDAGARCVSGVSLGAAGSSHDVFVYLPEARPWSWTRRQALQRDDEGFSARLVDAQVLRVHVRFENDTRVRWRIDFDDLFG
jgi:hypothetical protein